MKLTLALVAGLLGLIVTASAIMLIWMVIQYKQKSKATHSASAEQTDESKELAVNEEAVEGSPLKPFASMLLQWTYFDYALIGIFAVGSLFLFTDAIAVIRDAENYPLYHYGYLLCGFVFTFLSMLFMIVRFAAVLSLVRTGLTAPVTDQHRHPSQAEQSE